MSKSIQTLFHEARDLPASERDSYLRSACGSDAKLRSRIEALLQADAAANEFLPGLLDDLRPVGSNGAENELVNADVPEAFNQSHHFVNAANGA